MGNPSVQTTELNFTEAAANTYVREIVFKTFVNRPRLEIDCFLQRPPEIGFRFLKNDSVMFLMKFVFKTVCTVTLWLTCSEHIYKQWFFQSLGSWG